MKGYQKILMFFLLFLTTDTMNAQNNRRILLKQGYNNNPAVRFDNMTIEPVNLYIQPKPWNDRSPHLQLEIRITTPDTVHQSFLIYYEKEDILQQNNLPQAIGKYLFSLETEEGRVYLRTDTLKFGDAFIIDTRNKISAIIDRFKITYDSGWSGNSIQPDGSFGGCIVCHSFRLSEFEDEKIVIFSYESTAEKGEQATVSKWKEYKIDILDNFSEPLKVRVTKE